MSIGEVAFDCATKYPPNVLFVMAGVPGEILELYSSPAEFLAIIFGLLVSISRGDPNGSARTRHVDEGQGMELGCVLARKW
jgi:hypothetical protein